MKRIKELLVLGIISFLFMLGSCNFLNIDEYFNDMISLDTVFARQELLEEYLWGAAALLPQEGNVYKDSDGPFGSATDEMVMTWPSTSYAGGYLLADEITPFDTYYNVWGKYYQGIRKANTIFARIDECKDLGLIDRRDILGMTHFLRGYFYFSLLQLYGPVPIVPEVPLEVDQPTEALAFPRNTYDECVEYICQDLEKAWEYLELSRDVTRFEWPTKGAAMALMSRVRLYQASPWYNGNPFYSDWHTLSGQPFISQERSEYKWAQAATAALRVIESGQYSLHTVVASDDTPPLPANVPSAPFPDGAGGIDPYHSYKDMFNGEAIAYKNPEIIYAASLSSEVTKVVHPWMQGGWNGSLNITQELVDAYYMADGRDWRASSPEYPYPALADAAEPIGGSGKVFSGYTLSGKTAKMFDNREARFYATVGFCEAIWPGLSCTSQDKDQRINMAAEYYRNGNCQPSVSNPDDYNITGYTCMKYVHPEDCFRDGTIKSKTFPAIRYAEVLLNYVEALNELTRPHVVGEYTVARDEAQIMKYFNQIRFRAGLPGMTAQEAADPETVRKLIQRERMIEFAHEARRYHDVRRWGIAMDTENKPIRGMNVEARMDQREMFYQVITVDHKMTKRTFTHKMYFYPIPREVLDQNPKLQQNPGW